MKNSSISYILVAIVAGIVGYLTCLKVNADSIQLVNTQRAVIDQGKKVMWNNDLFDADGSDDMAKYLELCCEADSLWDRCNSLEKQTF